MSHAVVNGVELHYWQMGTGPDLVMIHGLGGNLAVWHFSIVAQLRDQFRITTYDMRGHGRSEMAPAGYSTCNQAEDLRALLDYLSIERASILGHSLGADIALHFGLRHPERAERLIAVDAMLPVMLRKYKSQDWEGWRYWAGLVKQMRGIDVPQEQWQDIEKMLTESFEVPVLFGPFRGRARNKAPITKLLRETSFLRDVEQIDDLDIESFAHIESPTLLIYDESSPFMETCRTLEAWMPDVQVALLPASELRHFGPLEQPDLIVELTADFLRWDGHGDGQPTGEGRA